MAVVVSKEGVWDVIAGSASNTPTLTLTDLKPGTFVKVTCHFGARSVLNDTASGFYYTLTLDTDSDLTAITPVTQILQGHEGWQTCLLMGVFEVLVSSDGAASISVTFNKGDLDGLGSLMNFTLLAEIIP